MHEVNRCAFPSLPSEGFFELAKQIYQAFPYFPEEAEKQALLELVKRNSKNHEIIFYWIVGECRLVGIFPHEGTSCHIAFFESVENPQSLDSLFDAFHHDAQQRGFEQVLGPYHFSTFYRYRTRLSDSPWQQFNSEPVNPAYYAHLLTSQGYGMKQRS